MARADPVRLVPIIEIKDEDDSSVEIIENNDAFEVTLPKNNR